MQNSSLHDVVGLVLTPINTGLLAMIVFYAGRFVQKIQELERRVWRLEQLKLHAYGQISRERE